MREKYNDLNHVAIKIDGIIWSLPTKGYTDVEGEYQEAFYEGAPVHFV